MRAPPPIRQATLADVPALAALRYEFRAALATPREARESFVGRCAEWMDQRLREAALSTLQRQSSTCRAKIANA